MLVGFASAAIGITQRVSSSHLSLLMANDPKAAP
jgi:hypothetical protein